MHQYEICHPKFMLNAMTSPFNRISKAVQRTSSSHTAMAYQLFHFLSSSQISRFLFTCLHQTCTWCRRHPSMDGSTTAWVVIVDRIVLFGHNINKKQKVLSQQYIYIWRRMKLNRRNAAVNISMCRTDNLYSFYSGYWQSSETKYWQKLLYLRQIDGEFLQYMASFIRCRQILFCHRLHQLHRIQRLSLSSHRVSDKTKCNWQDI